MAIYLTPITQELSRSRKFYIPLDYFQPRKYDTLSRYGDTERLYDELNGVYYHETPNTVSIPLSETDTYVTVTQQTTNRLDVIANNIYGYAPYWWIIAYANNIIDPYDVPEGTVLRCPPIMSIYGEGSVLE
jgi:hypothetical protein